MIRSNYMAGLVIVFVPSILINISLSIFYHGGIPQVALTVSLILLSICFLYLFSFISHVAGTIQPQNQLRIFEKNIPVDFNERIVEKMEENIISGIDPEDYFIDIQYIVQNKIQQREIYQFGEWLNMLIDKEIEYLMQIKKTKQDDEINPHGATHIVNYFLSLQKSIYSELVGIDDTRYIPVYSVQISNILGALIEIKSIAAMSTLSSHFERIGRDIVSYNQEKVFDRYFDSLEKLTLKTLNSVPTTDYRVSTLELPDQFENRSDPEYSWAKGIVGKFRNCVFFSRNLMKLAIDANFDGVAVGGSTFYVRLLERALDRDDEDMKRMDIVQTITQAQRDVFEYAVKEDALASYYTTPGAYRMMAQSSDELSNYLITEFCEATITAVKYDSYSGPHELGVAGRVLVEEHPELAMEIVETLIEGVDIVSNQTGFEDIDEQTVVKELSSIQDWENHNHQSINEVIEQALNSRDVDLTTTS